eukprot:TRINITY_DN4419_c0_g1_i1.p1 TRINITY_DN4419_c0_g1~~TRINITY_DN4419_c0_g1_i1.p1  ORF type:complete len:605 (+),score=77.23 TRINITY_DN4419_c0_g1_i1:171-1985(+)
MAASYKWAGVAIAMLGLWQILYSTHESASSKPCKTVVREEERLQLLQQHQQQQQQRQSAQKEEEQDERERRLQPPEYHFHSNEVGNWMWDPNGKHIHKLVVVVGQGLDPTIDLVKAGYLVWRQNLGCNNTKCDAFDTDRHEELLEERKNMGSAGPYYSYMRDKDFGKPKAPYVAFVNSSKVGFELLESLEASLHCASLTKKFTPIHRTLDFNDYPDADLPRVLEIFNKNFKDLRRLRPKKTLQSWGGGEFIVPTTLIDALPQEFYDKMFALKPDVIGPYFYLCTYHVVFNEPEEVETGAGIPSCDYPENTGSNSGSDETLPSSSTLSKTHHSVVRSNAIGTWIWNPKILKKNVLVVIGGTDLDPSPGLVSRGFMVWRRNMHCAVHLSKIWGAPLEKRHSRHICTESWGYLGYLIDRDPMKPVADYTVFIHGHLHSWHQPGDLALIIDDAVECAVTTGRYTPLTMVDMMDKWTVWENQGVVKRWINSWNSLFSDIRPIKGTRLQNWCCASFVLPRAVIEANPISVYERYLAQRVRHALDPEMQLTGFFSEYTHHLLFNEPEVVDITDIPQCTNFRYAEGITHKKSKRMFQQEEVRQKTRGKRNKR